MEITMPLQILTFHKKTARKEDILLSWRSIPQGSDTWTWGAGHWAAAGWGCTCTHYHLG